MCSLSFLAVIALLIKLSHDVHKRRDQKEKCFNFFFSHFSILLFSFSHFFSFFFFFAFSALLASLAYSILVSFLQSAL